MLEMFQRHKYSRIIQKYRKNYNKRMKEVAAQGEIEALNIKIKAIILIQSHFRKNLIKKIVQIKLNYGRLIVKAGIWYIGRLLNKKYIKARLYYNNVLKRLVFNMIILHTEISYRELSLIKGIRLKNKTEKILLNKFYNTLIEQEDEFREMRLNESAIALWESHILNKIISSWKTIVGETLRYKLTNSKKFMIVSQLHTHNSQNR